MKKRRFIAGILVLSMLLLGTGYAYWTQKLHVTTTATTGDLNVKFLDLTLYGQYNDENGWTIYDGLGGVWQTGDHFFSMNPKDYNVPADTNAVAQYDKDSEGYNDVEFNVQRSDKYETINDLIRKQDNYYDHNHLRGSYTGDTEIFDDFSITLKKIYPGYAQAFNADIANFGTVAAKLTSLKANLDSANSTAVSNALGMGIYLTREYGTPGESGSDMFRMMDQSFGPENIFEIAGVKFVRFSALSGKELSTFIEDLNELYIDPSKNRVDVYITIGMDPAAENTTEFGAATVGLDFNWTQFNNVTENERMILPKTEYKENIMKGK